MWEIFAVGAIIIFLLFYTGKINTGKFVADNSDLFLMLKVKIPSFKFQTPILLNYQHNVFNLWLDFRI